MTLECQAGTRLAVLVIEPDLTRDQMRSLAMTLSVVACEIDKGEKRPGEVLQIAEPAIVDVEEESAPKPPPGKWEGILEELGLTGVSDFQRWVRQRREELAAEKAAARMRQIQLAGLPPPE